MRDGRVELRDRRVELRGERVEFTHCQHECPLHAGHFGPREDVPLHLLPRVLAHLSGGEIHRSDKKRTVRTGNSPLGQEMDRSDGNFTAQRGNGPFGGGTGY
eukprot:1179819-Prorocentrum_minimum.AAC.4